MAKNDWLRKKEHFRSNLPEEKDSYIFGGLSLGSNRLVITNAKSMNNKDPQDVPKIRLPSKDEVIP